MQTFRQELMNIDRLDNLRDKPDCVSVVRVTSVTHDSNAIEWDKPKSYGSEITSYRIYMGQTSLELFEETVHQAYEFKDLSTHSHYYMMITAVNELGESYKPEVPFIV
jgi:acyl-CoA hydrolase